MTVFAVEYIYAENSSELRNEYRPAHREFLGQHLAEDSAVRILASGPTPSNDRALLIMQAETQEALEAMLAQDPFAVHGAVAETVVNTWNPVTGLLSDFAW